ncbi:MAG: GNAT family N-acetyltransferase [Roseobacter sp.]
MTVSADALFDAVEATWPAAALKRCGPWLIRDGQGGGKRVSAATLEGAFTPSDIPQAEDAMAALGQTALFMLRDGDTELDAALGERGYKIVDPVVVLTCPIELLTDLPVPPLAAFEIWEPLAIMEEIWAKGGIGPARIEVMRRAQKKTAFLARSDARPAGTAFVGVDGKIAMAHAVEVLLEHRRKGVAQWMMRAAAFWGQAQGADMMAVLCTQANTAALGLYSGLGFEPAAQYHYRHNPTSGDLRDG